MANMAHCRFQNTLRDLADCELALDELLSNDFDSVLLSEDEERAAAKLVEVAFNIVQMVADAGCVELAELDDTQIIKAVIEPLTRGGGR